MVATFRRPRRRAFALLEVLFAAVLLAFVSMAVISGLSASTRIARLNTNAVAAKNIAQGFFERMNSDAFADVGAQHYPDIPHDPESGDPVAIDEALGITCAVSFAFKGFGTATSGAEESLTDASAAWTVNEWQGDTLYLVDGRGGGQFREIVSNTATTLTVTPSFSVRPGAGTRYMVNNGKTAEVTTSWAYLDKTYSQTIESLIINYRDSEDLGF